MTINFASSTNDNNQTLPVKNPLAILQEWLETAEKTGVNQPRGFVLSTVDTSNHPSSRVVLLKDCDSKGIIFATNKASAKGKDLESNPWAAGTLWWRESGKQVNFRGQVVQLSKQKSEEMFQARPRDAQAVDAVSKQSAPLINETKLRNEALILFNSNSEIKCPAELYVYHLTIKSIEFWQGSKDHFHKRLRYDLIEDSWCYQYLQP